MDADRHSKEDELVPLARIVAESGLPRYRVLLALGEAGDRLRVVYGKNYEGREDRRKKFYPLGYTLALLKETRAGEREKRPEIEADERVPFERVVAELGLSPNTAKKYLAAARRAVITFPDPEDSRKKLYPLRYTVKLLQREYGRVKARQSRMKDEGAGYWSALAQLKVAESRLRQLASEATALSKAVRTAFKGLRRRPAEVGRDPYPSRSWIGLGAPPPGAGGASADGFLESVDSRGATARGGEHARRRRQGLAREARGEVPPAPGSAFFGAGLVAALERSHPIEKTPQALRKRGQS